MTSGLYKQVPRKDATLKLRMIFPSTFTIAVSQSSQSLEQGPRKVPGLRVRCPAGVNRARLLSNICCIISPETARVGPTSKNR